MKTVFKIAKTELQTLFCSPIAWLILVIFTIQCATTFNSTFTMFLSNDIFFGESNSLTYQLFSGMMGFFTRIQGEIYLYIPLLTMGLMSREFASGSIKLLYSSPVTNRQIIWGKYLSIMIYTLLMVVIMGIFCAYGALSIENADVPLILTGLLGFYLLMCAYSAVGLFMSCITSYQIVAAICTMATLFVLRMVGRLWQDIEFVRDLSYWLSINGRVDTFIGGMICSQDVIYFILVALIFIFMSTVKLQGDRQKSRWTATAGKIALIWICALGIGYLSARPKLMFYHDSTRTKINTLTPASQDILAQATGKASVTFYGNILGEPNHIWYTTPSSELQCMRVFNQYTRFKPEMKMKFVRYYAKGNNEKMLDERYPGLTDLQRVGRICDAYRVDSTIYISKAQVDRIEPGLADENYRYVMALERETGEKTFIRMFDDMIQWPTEAEISAAFKRVTTTLPKVAFVTGQGERDIYKLDDRNYNRFANEKTFRYALINQGFDFEQITLDQDVPDYINTLVIAELKEPLTEEQNAVLDRYVARGGNMLITSEPRRIEIMNQLTDRFGVTFQQGTLVKLSEKFAPDLMMLKPTDNAKDIAKAFDGFSDDMFVTMPSASVVDFDRAEQCGFNSTVLLTTDSLCWNETSTVDFTDNVPECDSLQSEPKGKFPTAVALWRNVADRQQRIVVLGDADCLSNGELNLQRKGIRSANYTLISGSFYWLSNNEVPVDVSRPEMPDKSFTITKQAAASWKWIFLLVIPILLTSAGIVIWVRRRGR